MARTDEPTPADIKSQYGFVALIGKQVPEIRNLLNKAVKEKWTAQRFSMAVAGTNWWRKTPSETRAWLVATATDPASAQLEMRVGGDEIRNRAKLLGFNGLSGADSTSIWLHAKLTGKSESAINAEIFRRAQPKQYGDPLKTAQTAGGRYGELINEMFATAADYGYITGDWKKSPAVRQVWHEANKIMQAGGEANTEAWRTKMINYASSKFAPFADRIRAGETVNDIAQPYVQALSQTLELNPHDISLDDKLLKRALQGTGAKPGEAMAVWQLEQEARSDRRWRKTGNARDAAGEMAMELGKMFGKEA